MMSESFSLYRENTPYDSESLDTDTESGGDMDKDSLDEEPNENNENNRLHRKSISNNNFMANGQILDVRKSFQKNKKISLGSGRKSLEKNNNVELNIEDTSKLENNSSPSKTPANGDSKLLQYNNSQCKNGKKSKADLGQRVSDASGALDNDRFFSAYDFFQRPTQKSKGKSNKSRTKASRSRKDIPLVSFTISRNERKKISYLEQYKKKCARKLKTVMTNKTELKDGSEVTTLSDRCSVCSKHSEISLHEPSKEIGKAIDVSRRNVSASNVAEEECYYDSINKYEVKDPVVNYVQTNVNYINRSNLERNHLNPKNTSDGLCFHRKSTGSQVSSRGSSAQKSSHSNAEKDRSGLDVEKSKTVVESPQPRPLGSGHNLQFLYVKGNCMRSPGSGDVATRVTPVQKLKLTNSTVPKEQSSVRPNQKTTVASSRAPMVSKSHRNSKPPSGHPPCTSSSFSQKPRENKRKALAQGVAKTAAGYITEGKVGNIEQDKQRNDRINNENGFTNGLHEDDNQMRKDISNQGTEEKAEKTILLCLTKNTQSETALPVETSHGRTVEERPKTTNNKRSAIPVGKMKKSYVEIYHAQRNFNAIPILIPKRLPNLPAKSTKKNTEEVKKERRAKTPHRKGVLTKEEGNRTESTPKFKRYYLKKRAPINKLEAKETEEDLKELKILEEKREMLEKQVRSIVSTKARSINIL